MATTRLSTPCARQSVGIIIALANNRSTLQPACVVSTNKHTSIIKPCFDDNTYQQKTYYRVRALNIFLTSSYFTKEGRLLPSTIISCLIFYGVPKGKLVSKYLDFVCSFKTDVAQATHHCTSSYLIVCSTTASY